MSHQFGREIYRNNALEILIAGEGRIHAPANIGLVTDVGPERASAVDLMTVNRSIGQRKNRTVGRLDQEGGRLIDKRSFVGARFWNKHQFPALPVAVVIPESGKQRRSSIQQ